MGKSMFSSKKGKSADEQDDVRKESFLGKLNKPLFASKAKRVKNSGAALNDTDELVSDTDVSKNSSEESNSETFLGKLNKPMFAKTESSDGQAAQSGKLSFFSKKQSENQAAVSKIYQPYTMFGKPIKGNLIAIDCTDEAVRVVVAKQKRHELEIIKTASATLPEGVVLKGEIVDQVTLKDVLSDLMEEHSITAKYAFFALSNTGIIARSVDIAAAVQNDEDIQGLVSYELQQYLDIDPTTYVIQYQETEDADPEAETKSLMVYAVPQTIVEQYLTLANHLKLTPYVFDLQSNTFEKWLERVQAINNRAKKLTEQNIGLVHLGKTSVAVYLYAQGKFVTSNYHETGYEEILNAADDQGSLKNLSILAADDVDTGILKQAVDDWFADTKAHILNTENFFSGATGQTIDTFYVFGEQDICWQLASILKAKLQRDFVSIDTIDYENVLWEETAEFDAEFIPATAMLIRRSN